MTPGRQTDDDDYVTHSFRFALGGVEVGLSVSPFASEDSKNSNLLWNLLGVPLTQTMVFLESHLELFHKQLAHYGNMSTINERNMQNLFPNAWLKLAQWLQKPSGLPFLLGWSSLLLPYDASSWLKAGSVVLGGYMFLRSLG